MAICSFKQVEFKDEFLVNGETKLSLLFMRWKRANRFRWDKVGYGGALVVSSIAVLPSHSTNAYSSYDVVLYFPLDRYPETDDHIRDAIAAG
jgi:hypothetical protein